VTALVRMVTRPAHAPHRRRRTKARVKTESRQGRTTGESRLQLGFVVRHPFAAFVLIAYAFSWTLWVVSYLGGGTIPFLLGVFGPMTAAGLVTWWTGGSLRTWLRPAWHWRVRRRWWAYALGLPALLFALVSLRAAARRLPRRLASGG
jgi:hypothetical protein